MHADWSDKSNFVSYGQRKKKKLQDRNWEYGDEIFSRPEAAKQEGKHYFWSPRKGSPACIVSDCAQLRKAEVLSGTKNGCIFVVYTSPAPPSLTHWHPTHMAELLS